jgi:hypothetical protein
MLSLVRLRTGQWENLEEKKIGVGKERISIGIYLMQKDM